MKNQRIVVAVDGPAGSGKSSVSKKVALELGLKYIDSGAVYRSITWHLLQKYKIIEKGIEYAGSLKDIIFSQTFNKDASSSVFIGDSDISDKIRDEEIVRNIGIVSDDIGVRNYVNTLLRKWSGESSIIMDGRDIGAVVFPNADIKIYLDATVDIRAHRRVEEYLEKGKNVDIKDIKNQIALRDSQDKTRIFGRLERVDGANYIDTSEMNIDEVIQKIISIINV